MNRGNLKTYCLARCSGLQGITQALLDIMIQKAADDVAARTLCKKENGYFSVVADQARYNASTIVTGYICMGEAGLWWSDGSDFKELKPKTMGWIKEHRQNWINEESGAPEYVVEDGDELLIVPAPDTSLTDGFWIDFYQKAYNMTDDAHYPFYGTSEIAKLSILDEAIVAHFRWKGLGITGKSDDYNLAQREYEAEIVRVQGLLQRNKALGASPYNKMMGRLVR